MVGRFAYHFPLFNLPLTTEILDVGQNANIRSIHLQIQITRQSNLIDLQYLFLPMPITSRTHSNFQLVMLIRYLDEIGAAIHQVESF
jgi:hypothetical protein